MSASYMMINNAWASKTSRILSPTRSKTSCISNLDASACSTLLMISSSAAPLFGFAQKAGGFLE